MKKQKAELRDYDFGLHRFEDMYTLFTLTAYIKKKFKLVSIVDFYKKLIPNHTQYEIEFYEKIEKVIDNIYRCTLNEHFEYNHMDLSDKDILKRISLILNNILPF